MSVSFVQNTIIVARKGSGVTVGCKAYQHEVLRHEKSTIQWEAERARADEA